MQSGKVELNIKAVKSGVALFQRQIRAKLIGILAGVYLARILDPAEFGFYAVATFATSFFNIFGDFGLAASLVRQPVTPTRDEEVAVFTVQQLIIILPAIALYLVAPWIAHLYGDNETLIYCMRWLSLAAAVSSFRSIPAMRLERNLDLQTLAGIEIIEVLVYQCMAIALALQQWGAMAFSMAVAVSQLAGVVCIYAKTRWTPGWRFDPQTVKSKIAFGAKFQAISIVSFIRDSVNPLFIGLLSGPAAVGLIGFALTLANYPVWATGILGRVYFPLFARHQDDPEQLTRSVAVAIRLNNVVVIAFSAIFMPLAHILVPFFFGAKWLPALPLIYCLVTSNVFAATTWPLIALCNASGRPQIPLRFSIWLTLVLWSLTVPLVMKLGVIGFGLAIVGTNLVNIAFFRKVQEIVHIDMRSNVGPPLMAGLVVALVSIAIEFITKLSDPLWAVAMAGIELALFFVLTNAFTKNQLWKNVLELKRAVHH